MIYRPRTISVTSAAALALLSLTVAAQPTGGNEDSDESAPPTPRLPDGTVDLGGDGVWDLPWITDFGEQLVDEDAEVPFLPWTKAMYDYNEANRVSYDPQGFCLPPGGPRAMGTPYPAELIQQDDRIVIIFEGGAHVWREIHMDGRELPDPETLTPTYFGYSVGRWEGDTLVVEAVGFNEKTWLNFGGYMHTDELRTVERFTRPDQNTLRYEATLIDPGAYSEPWTIVWEIDWNEGQELTEYICQENNQFLLDLTDDYGNPFFKKIGVTK